MSEPFLIFLDPAQIDKMSTPTEPERPEYDGYSLEHICKAARLSKKETEVIKYYYSDGLQQRDVGKCLHIKQSGISKILRKARNKIKLYVTNSEYWQARLKTIIKTDR